MSSSAAAVAAIDAAAPVAITETVIAAVAAVIARVIKGNPEHPAIAKSANEHTEAEVRQVFGYIARPEFGSVNFQITDMDVARALLQQAKDRVRSTTAANDGGMGEVATATQPDGGSEVVQAQVADAAASETKPVDGDAPAATAEGVNKTKKKASGPKAAEKKAAKEAAAAQKKADKDAKAKAKADAKAAREAAKTVAPASGNEPEKFEPVATFLVDGEDVELKQERTKKILPLPTVVYFEGNPAGSTHRGHQVDPTRRISYTPVMPNVALLASSGNPYPATADDTVVTTETYKPYVAISHHTFAKLQELGELRGAPGDAQVNEILERAGVKNTSGARTCIQDTLRDLALFGLATQLTSGRSRLFKKV